ncbi:MAG: carboxypeptidase-like regulatory domain-containing protein [Chitinophagaceae bacterium]|nr:carboxypeptidase-like regulatory domain-containing protein [Chitinophagaceae bacterium]
MKNKWLVFYVCTSLLTGNSFAQSVLKGKVVDDLYDRVVMGANVKNLSDNKISQADMGGNYKINAKPGDKIAFSSIGYLPDTIVVTSHMLAGTYDIALNRNVIELEEVAVGELNAYQVDSISRIEEFGDVLNKPRNKLVGGKGNTPTDGVGVAFSPLSHFSKEEKNRRRFIKRFDEQEKEYYIDYKFPYTYVSKITGLTGDSLRTFMFKYRPSYEFCRQNAREGMLVYINDSYRDYMDRKTPGSEKQNKTKKVGN